MPMSDSNLVAFLEEHRRHSIGRWQTDIATQQDENLKRYMGLPYGDEEQGRSQVVAKGCAEVVDWAMPDLLEPFLASDKTAEFEPVDVEDEGDGKVQEEFAAQATDYVNHIFWKDNDGFSILHDGAKDGYIQKTGIAKVCWVTKTRTVKKTWVGQSIIQVEALREDENIEILEEESEPLPALQLMNETLRAAFPDGMSYTVVANVTYDRGRIEIHPVPVEEFRITQRAVDNKTAPYTAHICQTTKGDVLEMGFDVPDEVIREAHDAETEQQKTRKDTRFAGEPRQEQQADGAAFDWTRDKVTLMEEYVWVDYNEDGDQELMKVFRIGNTILEKEEVPCTPWAVFCPYPVPHRFFGESLVDKTRQNDRVTTVLRRQMLDNVYLANNPRTEVPEDAITPNGETIDDLLNFRVGGLIRTAGQGGMLKPHGVPDMSATALQALQYMESVRESESGIVRAPVGLSAEAIDKDLSATQASQIERGSKKRDRLVARIFANDFVCVIYQKILKLVIEYQDAPRMIRLRGKFVAMDPRPWNADMTVTASVGLGYPNRETEIMTTQVIKNAQVEAAELGMAGPEQFWESAKDLVQAAGKRFPEKYFVDPTSEEYAAQQAQQQEQPDPTMIALQQRGELKILEIQQSGQLKMIEMQQDAQIDIAKARMNQEIDLIKVQMQSESDGEKTDADFEADLAKVRSDFDAQMAKIMSETEIASEKMAAEFALAIRKQNTEAALAVRQQELQAEDEAVVVEDVQFGGQVG